MSQDGNISQAWDYRCSLGGKKDWRFDMKERPILFSGPMVRAILEGKKTQTRRVVRPQPKCPSLRFYVDSREWRDGDGTYLKCPYGVPGDRLWVRETWYSVAENDHLKPSEMPHGPNCEQHWGYTAGFYNKFSGEVGKPGKPKWAGRTRASIHMPRWASRLTLEVVSVEVERLREITEADVFAEGVKLHYPPDPDVLPVPEEYGSWHIPLFVNLWNSLNAKRGFGWDTNPWVLVVSFKPLTPERMRLERKE